MITYTYRHLADGSTHTLVCDTIWQALNRAEYDVEEQRSVVEPVRIAVRGAVFEQGQILALLETWTNPAIINREMPMTCA